MARWTKEKPTVPGFYWYRWNESDTDPQVVQADIDLKLWICGWENPLEVGEMDYSSLRVFDVEFWDEPIAAPPESR
jgi:hypothetical protein